MNQYETLYGVTLLDDLHNYFPALLYDSSAFSSVSDLLQYVQQQARNRFDLFSFGRQQYQQQHPPRVSPLMPTSVPGRPGVEGSSLRRVVMPHPPPNSTNQTYVTTTLPSVPFVQPTNPRVAPMFGTVEITTEVDEPDLDEENDSLLQTSQMLLNLMNAVAPVAPNPTRPVNPFSSLFTVNNNNRRRNQAGLEAFLQPVIVRPTPEQIAANTSLGNLVSDTEHTCAICQDILTAEQEGRKLNACGHWFHRSCIDTWFQRDVHCPVCRHDIRDVTEAPSTEPPA